MDSLSLCKLFYVSDLNELAFLWIIFKVVFVAHSKANKKVTEEKLGNNENCYNNGMFLYVLLL